jgi:drug/metabolite transporter (DMT)-like permease
MPDRRRGLLLAASGVLILSVDALLIRLAAVDGWTVLFWRGLFMALSLTAAAGIRSRGRGLAGLKSPVTWLIALSFSFSTAAFVLSIFHTRVANTVVIISSAPLFAALFSAWFLRERVPLRTWLAIFGACGGVLIVGYHSLGAGRLLGDGLALGNAVFMGGSMVLLRRFPEISRRLVLAASGLVLALLALPGATLLVPGSSLLVLAVMGLVQMPLSLLLLTSATRHLPAPEVSLFLLLETLLAPIWTWWALDETIPGATLAGGAVIVIALVLHALWSLRGGPRSGA